MWGPKTFCDSSYNFFKNVREQHNGFIKSMFRAQIDGNIVELMYELCTKIVMWIST
jgi:hypothetical protein